MGEEPGSALTIGELALAAPHQIDNAAAALDQMGAYLNRDAVSSRLSTLEAEFDKLSGKVKDSSKVAVDRLEAEVTERPLAALAVAFGVGLMAAQLLRRK